jgi:ABC-type branched-subunit amino acid transport system ATPase component
MQLCGIEHLAGRRPSELSTGQRRLVELARCIAGDYRVMLLDEPSSGLDKGETRSFARILQTLVEQRGVGILLVEHDMALVMSVCSYIYVLDFGQPIFEGTPVEVSTSPVVRAAYLGSEAVEDSISAGPNDA